MIRWLVPLLLALIGSAHAQTPPTRAVATVAAGCFWCVEADFDKVEGVLETTSGYAGGKVPNPTYEQVSAGGTGHTEVVQIVYDPSKLSYEKLLDVFWRNVDPLAKDRQFCDVGSQYRSAIFFHDDAAAAAGGRIEEEDRSPPARRRSSPKSSRPAPSTRPRNIIRTTIRRIPRGTASIAGIAAATGGCRNSGARNE